MCVSVCVYLCVCVRVCVCVSGHVYTVVVWGRAGVNKPSNIHVLPWQQFTFEFKMVDEGVKAWRVGPCQRSSLKSHTQPVSNNYRNRQNDGWKFHISYVAHAQVQWPRFFADKNFIRFYLCADVFPINVSFIRWSTKYRNNRSLYACDIIIAA